MLFCFNILIYKHSSQKGINIYNYVFFITVFIEFCKFIHSEMSFNLLFIYNSRREGLFCYLSVIDFLFHCTLGKESIDIYWFFLPKPEMIFDNNYYHLYATLLHFTSINTKYYSETFTCILGKSIEHHGLDSNLHQI